MHDRLTFDLQFCRLKKQATKTFSMIQKYMGDRKDEDDIGTGREVCATSLVVV